MTGTSDLVATLAPVLELLDELANDYALGGSVASSAYGTPRSTMDVDLVARVEQGHAARFEAALGENFYVSADMIRTAAVRRRRIVVSTTPPLEAWVASPEDIILKKLGWSPWRISLGGAMARRGRSDPCPGIRARHRVPAQVGH